VKTQQTALLIALLALAGAPAAHAQVFGQYGGAAPVPMNGHQFGAYVNTSSDVVGLAAQLRLSFYPGVDFGFYGGLDRVPYPEHADRTAVRLATDIRIAVAKHSAGFPLDLAVVGGLGVESADGYQVLALGPYLQASRDLGSATSGVTPYAGVGAAYASTDIADKSENDVSWPVRVGLVWRVAADVHILAELQFPVSDSNNDDMGFSVGVNLPF
jgi:hypothetical protein